MNSRRQFLIQAPIGFLGAMAACRTDTEQKTPTSDLPPGAPPAFGTAPGVGPTATATTFAEAEKLAQVAMTPAQREQAAASWRSSIAPYLERRVGPRKVALAAEVAPATQ